MRLAEKITGSLLRCGGSGKIKSKIVVKVPINLRKRKYAYTIKGDVLELMLKISARTDDDREIMMRVSAALPNGVTLSNADIIHTVNMSLRDALLGADPTFTAIDGSKFKIRLASAAKKDFSDMRIKIPERGLMGDIAKGSYIFDIKVSFPDTSKLSNDDCATLGEILSKL